MATAKVKATLNSNWTDVAGSAANTAGVTWQNVGRGVAWISFSSTLPDASTAYHELHSGESFYDKSGSAKVYARQPSATGGTAILTATSD